MKKTILNKGVLFYVICGVSCLFAEYYSQDNQDKFVYDRFFKGQKKGFFVDIGAHEGILLSNTYFFEKLGWEGVCFEPDPRTFEKLKENRHCHSYNYAVGSRGGMEKFIQHPKTWVSGLDRTYCNQHRKCWNVPKGIAEKYFIDVEVVTFNRILDELETYVIDFLSIDTEGAEKDILTSIDYDKFYIKVMTIENKYHDKSIGDFLRSKGFIYVTRLQRDEVYVNQLEKTN